MSTPEATPAVPAEPAAPAVEATHGEESVAADSAAQSETSEYERERGKPVPSVNHSRLQIRLAVQLYAVEPRYTVLSELTFLIDDRAVTPDLCLYPPREFNYEEDEVRIEQVPLLAVEIASPSQSTSDIVTKINRMLDAGVKSCWLVQPAMQTITVYTDGERPRTYDSGTLTDPNLDVEVDVRSLFDVATPEPEPDA